MSIKSLSTSHPYLNLKTNSLRSIEPTFPPLISTVRTLASYYHYTLFTYLNLIFFMHFSICHVGICPSFEGLVKKQGTTICESISLTQ